MDLLNSDGEEDGDDDNVLDYVGYTEKKTEQDDKMKEITKTFLGGEGEGGSQGKQTDDIILDDESNELLNQIKDQVNVEKKYSHLDKQRELDLEQRYLELKQNPPNVFTTTTSRYEEEDNNNNNNNRRLPGPPPKPIQVNELHDEMDDWCIICNEDATVECKGCDNDRFCDRCWFDGHRSDMADYEAMKHKFTRLTSS